MTSKKEWKAIGFSGGPWTYLQSATKAAMKQGAVEDCYVYNTFTHRMYDVTGEEVGFLTGSQRQSIVGLLASVLLAPGGAGASGVLIKDAILQLRGSSILKDSLAVAQGVTEYANRANKGSGPSESQTV